MTFSSHKPNYSRTVMNLPMCMEILRVSWLKKKTKSRKEPMTLSLLGIFFFFYVPRPPCIFPEKCIFPDILASHYFHELTSLQCLFQILTGAGLSSLNNNRRSLIAIILSVINTDFKKKT